MATILSLCAVEEKKSYNLDELKQLIGKYFNEGIQTQLNRRRTEAGENIGYLDNVRRLGRTGKSLFELYRE
jgi:hypothetical protein